MIAVVLQHQVELVETAPPSKRARAPPEPAAEPAKTGSGERDVPPVPGAARAAGKRERPAAACFGAPVACKL